MHGLKHEFNQTVTLPSDAPCRTIKVINADTTMGDAGTSTFRIRNISKKPQLQRDPLMAKGLQRYVLSLPFDEIDEHSLNDAAALPDTFASCKEYSSIFEPLLHLECRAQILGAKREMDARDPVYRGVITSIVVVDEMHELTFAFSDFVVAKDICELDLLVSTSGPSRPVLGMVCKTSIVREKEIELVVRVHFAPSVPVHQFIRQGSTWHFHWVCNLVTNLREYLAVQNMPLISVHKTILDPRATKGLALPEAQIETTAHSFGKNLGLNESQARAVATALLNPNPFTLIQGPPGTGKTRAIEGLLGAIFSAPSHGNPVPARHPRALICAPSNAAIDEIVRRIKHGIRDSRGNRIHLKVIRIGAQDSMHEQVRDVSIEYLVEKQLEERIGETLRLAEGQKAQIKDLKGALDACTGNDTSCLAQLKSQLWQAREDARRSGNHVEEAKQSIRQRLFATAHVVCSTLSGSGHDLLAHAGLDFGMVIIDEACQAVEPSSLIPLQYNCQKCVLVGDPNQLPPTIMSQAAVRLIYDQSLFKRLQKFMPVQLLNVQYRMHPEISRFPSKYFYCNALKDASDMLTKCSRPWSGALGSYKFFDIPGTEEANTSHSGRSTSSLENRLEGKTAVALVAMICSTSPRENMFGRIAVITPYKEQKRKIQKELVNRFGESSARGVEVSTVDGFQGQEREIIILSCVRTGESRNGLGFLSDARRMNVALTRAKCSLYILGNSPALMNNPLWGALIQDARTRGVFIPYQEGTWRQYRHTQLTNLFKVQSPLATSLPMNDKSIDSAAGERAKRRHQ